MNSKIVPGGRLPTVRELMARYDASRTTIMSALKLLQDEEIIVIRPQSGSYLTENGWMSQNKNYPYWESYVKKSRHNQTILTDYVKISSVPVIITGIKSPYA